MVYGFEKVGGSGWPLREVQCRPHTGISALSVHCGCTAIHYVLSAVPSTECLYTLCISTLTVHPHQHPTPKAASPSLAPCLPPVALHRPPPDGGPAHTAAHRHAVARAHERARNPHPCPAPLLPQYACTATRLTVCGAFANATVGKLVTNGTFLSDIGSGLAFDQDGLSNTFDISDGGFAHRVHLEMLQGLTRCPSRAVRVPCPVRTVLGSGGGPVRCRYMQPPMRPTDNPFRFAPECTPPQQLPTPDPRRRPNPMAKSAHPPTQLLPFRPLSFRRPVPHGAVRQHPAALPGPI